LVNAVVEGILRRLAHKNTKPLQKLCFFKLRNIFLSWYALCRCSKRIIMLSPNKVSVLYLFAPTGQNNRGIWLRIHLEADKVVKLCYPQLSLFLGTSISY
jgi:hypothetical protein